MEGAQNRRSGGSYRRIGVGLLLVFVIVGGAATHFLTTASAGPPAPLAARIAVTRVDPVAGKLFTGFTAISVGWHIRQVQCDARIGPKLLPGRLRRFYSANSAIAEPAAVSCSWQIPADTGGKTLRIAEYENRAWINTTRGSIGAELSWRIEG